MDTVDSLRGLLRGKRSAFAGAAAQNFGHVVGCHIPRHHQDEQVVEQVGHFSGQFRAGFIFGGNDGFGRFLADLFENLVQPGRKQIGGVSAFRPFCLAFLDQGIQLIKQNAQFERAVGDEFNFRRGNGRRSIGGVGRWYRGHCRFGR